MTKAENAAKMVRLWKEIARCPLCVENHGAPVLCKDHNAKYKELKEGSSS